MILNNNQNKAVYAKERFIFLLAGAGTGKTRVLVERTKRFLKEGIHAENILLITFTKKGSEELKHRFKNETDIPFITTFHGFCYQMIKPYTHIDLIQEEDLVIEFSKDELRQIEIEKRNKKSSRLLKRYNYVLKKRNKLDFTDLELLMLKYLKKDKIFRYTIKQRFTHIFIDEFQDTSQIQFELIKQLKGEHTNLFCVGDPDQSIYAFRGANKRVIDAYISTFKATLYRLDLNYRSSKEIVVLANKLILHNKKRFKMQLLSYSEDLGNVVIKYFHAEKDIALFILSEIKALVKKSVPYQEMAVLYRNHYVSNTLKECLFNSYIEGINLLTIHQAKGLEFKAVFVIGLNEGILPMLDSEEERRLFYVAVTRAKGHLYLLVSTERTPSRFIEECIS